MDYSFKKEREGDGEWEKKDKLSLIQQYWSTEKNKLAEVKEPEEIKPEILLAKVEAINNITT